MRFLMIGISIIIGVILVGVVFSVTMDLTQPREVDKIVSFEILSTEDGTLTPGTYDKIISIAPDLDYYDNNIIETTIIINNTTYIVNSFIYVSNGVEISFIYNDSEDYFEIFNDDTWIHNGAYELSTNDQFQLIFTVEGQPQISSTSAILIALVPLLFATGVILYTYNTALRGREE